MSAVEFSAHEEQTLLRREEKSQNELVEIDAERFRANFNRNPFIIKHSLAHHPLFSLPRLVELSNILPPQHVIYHSGEIPPATTLYTGAPRNGLSSEETIRQIEECQSWMVLRYVERDPDYRELIDRVLDEVEVYTEPLYPGMIQRQGFIFITSPLAVTPWHTDPEFSFLFQIRGEKTLKIVSPSPLSERELEEYFADLRNPSFKEEYCETASTYALSGGEALHFPLTVPHWVHNGNAVSISISITFQTYDSDRRTLIYKTNNYMRKKGLKPSPYGQSYIRDSAKFYAFRLTRRAMKILGRSGEETRQTY